MNNSNNSNIIMITTVVAVMVAVIKKSTKMLILMSLSGITAAQNLRFEHLVRHVTLTTMDNKSPMEYNPENLTVAQKRPWPISKPSFPKNCAAFYPAKHGQYYRNPCQPSDAR